MSGALLLRVTACPTDRAVIHRSSVWGEAVLHINGARHAVLLDVVLLTLRHTTVDSPTVSVKGEACSRVGDEPTVHLNHTCCSSP